MKNKIIISLEGSKSFTEVNFYEQLQYKFPEVDIFEVFPLDGNSSAKELIIDIKNFITNKKKENAVLSSNDNKLTVPSKYFVYLIYDDITSNASQREKLNSNAEEIKSAISEFDIRIIKIKDGFEVGLIGELFTPPIKSMKKISEVFGWAKKIFKKQHNKALFDKILEKTGITTLEELKARLLKQNNEHYFILDDK